MFTPHTKIYLNAFKCYLEGYYSLEMISLYVMVHMLHLDLLSGQCLYILCEFLGSLFGSYVVNFFVLQKNLGTLIRKYLVLVGLNEIIGATSTIEGSAYWIALVVSWMQTLGSQPDMPKISPIIGTRGLPKP
jgi:hypothetical protein